MAASERPRHPGSTTGLTRRAFLAAASAGATMPGVASWGADRSASRIAALDWAGSEALLTLGVTPLAVADSGAYRRQFAHAPLPEQVPDLGGRWQPNLELLAQLSPDLIIVTSEHNPDEALQRRIAPLLAMSLHDNNLPPLVAAEGALRRVAGAAGRQEAAEVRIADAAASFDRAAENLAALAAPPLVVAVLEPDGRHVTVHAGNGLIGASLARIGLRNGWERPTASIWGFARVGVAELGQAAHAHIVFIDQGARTARALRQLEASTLWRNLPQVASRRVSSIPDLFPFGGLPTAVRFARDIESTLLKAARRAG